MLFFLRFPQLLISVNPSQHTNQIPTLPPLPTHFPYHVDYRNRLFIPRKSLSNLETLLYLHRYCLSVNSFLPSVFLPPAPNYCKFSNSNLIISVLIFKSSMIPLAKRIKFKLLTLTPPSLKKHFLQHTEDTLLKCL